MKSLQKKHVLVAFCCMLLLTLFLGACDTTTEIAGPGATPPPPPPPPPPLPSVPSLAQLTQMFPLMHAFPLAGAKVFNFSPAFPLLYHSGPVMQTGSVAYAIFWEPSHLQDGTPTHISRNYNSLIDRYFNDVGTSGVYRNDTQYFDTTGRIVNRSTLGAVWVDRSPYPASQCHNSLTPHGCLVDAQLQAEVTRAMKVNHWTNAPTHIFFLFTSWGEGSCYDRTSSGCAFSDYCAYHSYYTLGKQRILYANMPYTGTVPRNCDVSTSPNHDLDADSTINVTSHEQMETVTDPYLNAWYDVSDNEIGDKCAWTFGRLAFDGGQADAEWNGHFYIVQQEWSNIRAGCTMQL